MINIKNKILKNTAKTLTGLALIVSIGCGGGGSGSSTNNANTTISISKISYNYGVYKKNTPPPNQIFEVAGAASGEYDVENQDGKFLITKPLLFSVENKYFQIPAKDFEFIKELDNGNYIIDIRLYGKNNQKKFYNDFATMEIQD